MKQIPKSIVAAFVLVLTIALLGLACAPVAVPPTQVAAPAATPTPAVVAKPSPAAQASPAAVASPAGQASAAAQVGTAAQVSPPGKLTTVRFGSPGSISDAGVFVALEKGYFKDAGIDLQILPFQSAAVTVAPLAAGDLEVAGGTISTGLLNAIDRGVALKIVAAKGSSIKDFEFSRVTIRKDLIDSGQVKEPKDLKGKTIAVASAKSGAEAQTAYLLKQGGLSITDIELVPMGFPDMLAAYSNKAIDGAAQIEPTLNTGVEKGLAVRWPQGATSVIYGGEYQAGVLVLSEQFSKNIDAARRFMVGYLKGLRDYNDAFAKGKNKSDIIAILTKLASEKDASLYEKMAMPYLSPDGKMHMPSMQMDFDYFKSMGYYTGKLDLKPLVDTQFIDYAVQQLGPYK